MLFIDKSVPKLTNSTVTPKSTGVTKILKNCRYNINSLSQKLFSLKYLLQCMKKFRWASLFVLYIFPNAGYLCRYSCAVEKIWSCTNTTMRRGLKSVGVNIIIIICQRVKFKCHIFLYLFFETLHFDVKTRYAQSVSFYGVALSSSI